MPSDLPPLVEVRRRPWPLRLISSVWFGMGVLALILIYSSVMSALAPVRWSLEMTEMQAFRHWLFVACVALFALSLVAATLLRTRWMSLNAGAVVAHIGLLLLLGGAVAYFASKVEGDVLLQAPTIHIRVSVGGQSALIDRFPARLGETWSHPLPHIEPPVSLSVAGVEPRGVQPVGAAIVSVRRGEGEARFVRLTDAPDNWQPIMTGLEIRLVTYPPQAVFYDDEAPVLYFRNLRTGLQSPRRIDGLPIYRERYLTNGGLLRDSRGQEVPPPRVRPELRLAGLTIPTGWFERWRMPIEVPTDGLPFSARITGYVPFVRDLRSVAAADGTGGPTTVPVLAIGEERRADVSARALSAIRLELTGRTLSDARAVDGPLVDGRGTDQPAPDGRGADRNSAAPWSQTHWILFSLYPDVDARPVVVTPPDGTPWEVVYSRARHTLGASLAAGNLWVEFFPGRRGIKSYHSDIRVLPGDGGAAYPATVETNHTVAVGPWTLYQSGFAEDRWSYTILGVGNRVGMLPMNIGWILVTLGSLYAFYVKPVLLRRLRRVAAPLSLLLLIALAGCRRPEPYQASEAAARVDRHIDWSRARLIAIQDSGRYKTLDSFARESLAAMTGREHLPGLSPLASLLDWLFRRDAYTDTPVIAVRNAGLLARMVRPLSEDQRERIIKTKRLTPRELADPGVEQVLREAETHPMMRGAVNRVRTAQVLAQQLEHFIAIVPQPGGDAVAPWFLPSEVLANLSDDQLQQLGLSRADLPPEAQRRLPGLSADQALAVTVAWTSLRAAWLRGDAPTVQQYVDRLADLVPSLAAPGVYPDVSQRRAEARYYAAGKFTYGWLLYFLALLVSVLALVTGWRTPWAITLLLLLAGLAVHTYGISLRWYILGRIPVANMFEAVVASAAAGMVIVMLVEVFLSTRVLLVGASMTGFLALLAGQYALPGSELSIIPAILDDIQLRLHTVLIITAYALIFLAAVVAVIYLIGYYAVRLRGQPGAAPIAAANSNGAVAGVSRSRPILAGAAPGDDARVADLPPWLNNIDWSHLIILNMVFVLLFVGGVILGAWWADYSWGRPWGWDPKEVFALNTWIIYAILIHLRFVVRNRGLWTAWLSLAGCAMMAFNWFFVNFFISSVHSYA
ncbi:MAG: cytochrome c biogenesis protein CcsA [Planctomycetota bacterium]